MVVTYYNLEFYTFFPGDLSTMSLLEPLGLKSHPIIFTKWFFIPCPRGDVMYLVLPTWKIILTKYIIKHSYYVVHENLSKLRTYTQTIQNANSCNECFGEKLQQVMLIWLIFLFIRCVEVVSCCCWLFDY